MHLAPDLVHQFSSIPFYVKTNNNIKVGISIIDLKNDMTNDRYITFLISMITAMKNSNFNISFYIYAFDTGLEDDRIISKILTAKLDPSIHIESVAYTGDILAFTSLFASMDYMLCSRFHSIILSINFNIAFLPISYSMKTNNYLNTIGYTGEIIDAKSINEKTSSQYCNPTTCFSSFKTYPYLDKLVSESKIHMEYWCD
jgi:colanic acid/amylovoran biosynthesis protein